MQLRQKTLHWSLAQLVTQHKVCRPKRLAITHTLPFFHPPPPPPLSSLSPSLPSHSAGSDYTEVSSSVVTFGPDDLTQTVQVQILPDNVYERTERFFGNINNPSSGQIEVDGNQAVVSIQDETSKSDSTPCSCLGWWAWLVR